MNEIKTVTVDVKDYETIKKKAEAFDKLIEIACHDGVEFYQEWNKQDVRKACKGGSVKIGEFRWYQIRIVSDCWGLSVIILIVCIHETLV